MHDDFTEVLRRELAAWLGLAWLPGGGGLRGTDTGDRMQLDGI